MMNVERFTKEMTDMYLENQVNADVYSSILDAFLYGIGTYGRLSPEYHLFDGEVLVNVFIRQDANLGYGYPVVTFNGIENQYSEGNTIDGFNNIFEIIEAVKAERNNIVWK